METFKQIMGFVLLGTVVFILTFLDPRYVVPTIGLLFGLWAACWWIGRVSPTAAPGRKALAWLEAAAFAGVIWLVAFPGVDEIFPNHRFAFGGLADVMQSRFDAQVDRRAAAQVAMLQHSPRGAGQNTVLIDFTADWCLTCKTLEAAVLNTAAVREAVEKNGVVTLQADWTYADPEVTELLELLGSKQVPVVAIFPAEEPNRPIIFQGGYTQATLLDALQRAGPSKRAS
jgi:thiol:disulfide interchange protein DsbD